MSSDEIMLLSVFFVTVPTPPCSSAEWPALTYRGTEVVRPATADEKHSHARLMAARAQQATNKWLAEPAGQSPEPDTHQWDEEAQAVVEFSYFTQFDVPLVGGMVENVINSGAADEFPNVFLLYFNQTHFFVLGRLPFSLTLSSVASPFLIFQRKRNLMRKSNEKFPPYRIEPTNYTIKIAVLFLSKKRKMVGWMI
jgi:hypothetical protein